MDLRERDDTGWDDLPGGLSFSGDDSDDLGDVRPRRRLLSTLVWVLTFGVLLGGGGAWGARWLAESDVRAVLASSTSTYGGVLTGLREAPDPDALAAVAATAPQAARTLDDELARLTGDGGRRRGAVAAQVAAERDVLLAVGALAELDRAPLRVWGEAHGELADAVRAEEVTRSSLLLVDADAARRLPDTAAAVRRLGSTVGEAVVRDVTRAAADLLADLEAATGTGDLRAAAVRSEAQRTAVSAAGQGLGSDADGAVLAAFGDALLAVTELRSLSPDATGVWPSVRTRLQESLRVVADADSSISAGTVRGRLPLVLDAVDRLVVRAEEAHAAWVPVHDAAVAAQAADAAALRLHAERVRAAATGWASARTAVQALTGTGAGPAELDDAWLAVDGVRLGLVAAAPPAALAAPHAALLDAVLAVERPLRLARERALDGPVPVTPLLAGWDPAFAAWETALATADAEVAGRVPPPPPDV